MHHATEEDKPQRNALGGIGRQEEIQRLHHRRGVRENDGQRGEELQRAEGRRAEPRRGPRKYSLRFVEFEFGGGQGEREEPPAEQGGGEERGGGGRVRDQVPPADNAVGVRGGGAVHARHLRGPGHRPAEQQGRHLVPVRGRLHTLRHDPLLHGPRTAARQDEDHVHLPPNADPGLIQPPGDHPGPAVYHQDRHGEQGQVHGRGAAGGLLRRRHLVHNLLRGAEQGEGEEGVSDIQGDVHTGRVRAHGLFAILRDLPLAPGGTSARSCNVVVATR